MAVNPLISKKIEEMDIPASMKGVINELLAAKDEMETLGEDRQRAYDTVEKILIRYDDNEEIKRFCGNDD